MQRFIAITLLLCIAVLSPLQAAPSRWCHVEKTVLIAGFDDAPGGCCAAHAKGCGKCGASHDSPRSGEDTCCTALEPLPNFVTAKDMRLPAVTWLLVDWLPLPSLGRLDPFTSRREPVMRPQEPIPIAPLRRHAVLNVWTL